MTLQIAYIGLTLLMNLILIVFGFKAIGLANIASETNKKRTTLVIGLILWQVYVFAISKSGFLKNFDFPPRFFIFLVLPLFIFTGIFIFRNRKNAWIDRIPQQWLFYYQSFRVFVEILLAASFAQGILPKVVTIHGYNFDMIYAFTIPVIGFLVFQKKILPKKIAILWNYLGLTVLASVIFLFISSIFFPHLYGSEESIMSLTAATYPYTLVAGFLMPSAVFIHVLSIVQLNKASKD